MNDVMIYEEAIYISYREKKPKNWGNVLTTGDLKNNITSEIQGRFQYSFSNIDTMF